MGNHALLPVGSPVFAALYASEASGGKGGLALLVTDLAVGAVGFLLFTLLNVPMLLLFTVLKPPLLALSFKGGYLGGPIFPSLFTAS